MASASGGGKYEHFARFIGEYIDREDLYELNAGLMGSKLAEDPEAIKKQIEEFFIKKWNENSQQGSRGDITEQTKNFKKFVSDMSQRDKKNYKIKGKISGKTVDQIDFTDYYYAYRESLGVYKPKERGAVKKLGEKIFTPEVVVKPKNVNKEITKSARNLKEAIKRGDTETIIRERNTLTLLRKTLNDYGAKQELLKAEGKAQASLNSRKLYELTQKIDETLQPITQTKKLLAPKSNEYLINSLEAKGVDTSQFTNVEQIKQAAKNAGIGLREYDRNKEEYIRDIVAVSKFTSEDLQRFSAPELKKKWKQYYDVYKKPKKFVYSFNDLDQEVKSVKEAWKESGKTLTRQDVKKMRDYVEQNFPGLSSDEINKQANKYLLAEGQQKFVVPKPLIEKRLTQRWFGQDRLPTIQEREELNKIPLTKLYRLASHKEPLTGKITGDPVPREAIKAWKKENEVYLKTNAQKLEQLKTEQAFRQLF